LTWIMAAARARWSAGIRLWRRWRRGSEDVRMASELEWLGFASQVESGIREALDAAGVDCAMPGSRGAEYDDGFSPMHADDPYSP